MIDKAAARAAREIIQRDAIKLAAGAGVAAERGMLVPLLCARARIQHDADDAVVVEYQSVFGEWFVSGPDIMREMINDREFGKLFATPRAAPTKQRERNPFARGADFNLTEQMKLLKRDPTGAARLKAAAEEEAIP